MKINGIRGLIMGLLYSENKKDVGLLLLRIGIGIAFVLHGFPKIFKPEVQAFLAPLFAHGGLPGGETAVLLAGLAEFLGGLALVSGLLFRPATLVLAFNMLVAVYWHLNLGDNFMKYSHALESAILFIALFIIGPGKLSLDAKIFGGK